MKVAEKREEKEPITGKITFPSIKGIKISQDKKEKIVIIFDWGLRDGRKYQD